MKKATLLLLLFVFSNTFATTNNNTFNTETSEAEFNSVQIVRLNYTSPNGASRELLLGFTSDNSASDGIDYGYDATVSTPVGNDLNWLIEEDRYVIQGVGSFDNSKQYLFGLYNEVSGNATIELSSLENFNSAIDVFIYDSLLDTYTRINDTAYTGAIDAGDFTDRFYIAFSQPETNNNDTTDSSDMTDNSNVSTFDHLNENRDPKVNYLVLNSQLKVSADTNDKIKEVTVYNYNGRVLQTIKNINKNTTYLTPTTDDNNVIVHITTLTKTTVKQVVFNRQ